MGNDVVNVVLLVCVGDWGDKFSVMWFVIVIKLYSG